MLEENQEESMESIEEDEKTNTKAESDFT